MIYSGYSFEFSEFRIWIKAKVPDPFGSRSNPYRYYLSIFGNYKNTLNSIKKKILPPICHFLFYYIGTVIQYTQSRIHRPKMRNTIFNYLLFHFLLDPEQQFRIRIQAKVSAGSATLNFLPKLLVRSQ